MLKVGSISSPESPEFLLPPNPMSLPRQLGIALGATLLCAVSVSSATIRNAVTAVRFWSMNETTRVVVETISEFDYRSDRVSNPDRLFFDLKGATVRLGGKGQHTIQVSDRLLKQIRVAETQPGTTRIVFDLEADVEFSASQLSNPSRLII